MSEVTDVMVSIDTKAILEQYGKNTSLNEPQGIDGKHIFMIVTQDNAVSGEAGGNLNIAANVGDVIRWRETSLSLGFERTVIFYKFVADQGNALISPPKPMQADVTVPVPNPDDLTKPNMQPAVNHFWSSTMLNAGKVTYHFQFMIVDHNGHVCGYYQWDPYITIGNN